MLASLLVLHSGQIKGITGDTLYCFWCPRFHRYRFDQSNFASVLRTFSKGDSIALTRKRTTERKVYHCLLPINCQASSIIIFFREQQLSVFHRVHPTSVLPPASCFGFRLFRLSFANQQRLRLDETLLTVLLNDLVFGLLTSTLLLLSHERTIQLLLEYHEPSFLH